MRQRIAVVLTLGALAALLGTGCTGTVDNRVNDQVDAAPIDEGLVLFEEQVLPALTNESCLACHILAENGNFLAGGEASQIRERLLAFDPSVVNLQAPSSSRLLTKGEHSGPALGGETSAAILSWIEIEREALFGDLPPIVQTTPFSPQFCTEGSPGDPTCPINSIDLSELGSQGSTLEFVAQSLSSGLYLSEISLVGGETGAYVEHPLFLSWPEPDQKIADEFDRFFAAKINVPTGESAPVKGGAAVFVQFEANKPISVAFELVEPYHEEGGGGDTGGCKDLDSFNANAKAALSGNCVSCHGGGDAGAKSAMNLEGLVGDADVARACGEVLLKSDKDNPAQSSIFLTTDPGQGATHPFKFGGNATSHANFVSQVSIWIDAEKTAP